MALKIFNKKSAIERIKLEKLAEELAPKVNHLREPALRLVKTQSKKLSKIHVIIILYGQLKQITLSYLILACSYSPWNRSGFIESFYQTKYTDFMRQSKSFRGDLQQ